MNQFKNLITSNLLKYDASDISETENEIRYQIICCVIIINDSVWTKMSADDVECVKDVLNASCSLLINFLLISLSELSWEQDMFI